MKKQTINKITAVVNADCFKYFSKIRDDSVDLVLTDPPYEINYIDNIAKGEAKQRKEEIEVKTIKNDSEGSIDWETFFKECYRVLKPKKMLFLHCRTDMVIRISAALLKSKFHFSYDFLWLKGDMGYGNLNVMGVTHELIIALSKDKPEKSRIIEVDNVEKKRTPALYFGKTTKKEYVGHPTQKPVGLLMYIIKNRTNPEDLVLDPFCGSGSTLMAAQILNRKSLGIELDEDYYNITIERLQDKEIINMYTHQEAQGLYTNNINALSYSKPELSDDAPKRKRGKIIEDSTNEKMFDEDRL